MEIELDVSGDQGCAEFSVAERNIHDYQISIGGLTIIINPGQAESLKDELDDWLRFTKKGSIK